MSKNIAVILSGCGHLDGAEIRETVFTLLALDQAQCNVTLFAPDRDQHHVVNHRKGEETAGEKRHILTEASRLGRGEIRSLNELKAQDFSGLALPGGYGVAKNLCTFAFKGAACEVLPEIDKVINDFFTARKPIAALCIAPALIAKVLGKHGITVTIGNDPETAAEIQKTGAKHTECTVSNFVEDKNHRIFTTPAYMFGDARLSDIHQGINACLKAFTSSL
jgi:enhancing lycopene biosynthesis protein 2